MDNSIIGAGLAGLGAAFFASVALVSSKHIHGKHTLDSDKGVQKFHTIPTPRIGGIAIAGGFIVAWLLLAGEVRQIWGLIGLAGIPALAFGLTEDITKRVQVRLRLLATIFSGLMFAGLSGYSITSVDVPGLDYLLGFPVVAFAFTAFAVGGVANSINLIDGFHGLASGTLMVILLAFAVVGMRVGDPVLTGLSVTMLFVVSGFFLVNFPHGKLFLGDAGAYFAGYVVAVLAVMLPARNPEVSPWVSLLILGYPVTETLVSIFRRLAKGGHSPGDPDSDHLHHVVHRGWARKLAAGLHSTEAANAMTGVLIWALPVLSLLAVASSNLRTGQSLLLLALNVGVYLLVYRAADRAGKRAG